MDDATPTPELEPNDPRRSIQRLGRLRAMMVDRSEEVLNHIGGVIGYRISLDAEDTRRVFELLDGDGTEPTDEDQRSTARQKPSTTGGA